LAQLPIGGSRHSVVGEEAHIVAQSAGGPRGCLDPPGGDVDGYDNLVLLCRNDHKTVDDQPEVFSVIELINRKKSHEQWVAETLESVREVDATRRSQTLCRLQKESIARCVDRWQAVGLRRHLASRLAEDRTVGARPELGGRVAAPVTVLVGDVGSGKSLAGERLHQDDIARALTETEAPAPVWLRALDACQGLDKVVEEAIDRQGIKARDSAVSMVLDGLDEVGPSAASSLLSEVRRLIYARDGSRAVVTTRFLDAIGNDDERVSLSPLSKEHAEALIALVSGVENFKLWSYAKPIQDAATRPLFAIALGRILADQPGYTPAATAELIDKIVQIAVGTEWHDVRDAIVALAVAVLRADGGSVRAPEVVPAHRLKPVLATRLVVEEKGRLRFPLIVFAQWFAAEAVLGGDIDVQSLLDVPRDLELWRYPLAIAASRGSQAQVAELLGGIAERNPAFASVVISDALQGYASSRADLGTWQEAGKALLEAEGAWIRGLGSVADLIAPVRDGAIESLGVRIDGSSRLTTAWYNGQEPHGPLFELEPGFFPLDVPPGFGPARSAECPDGPAWPWRWTRDELKLQLTRVLAGRQLVLAGTPLEHEAVWAGALQALGRSAYLPGPVDVSPLLATGAQSNIRALAARGSGLSALLERYVDEQGMLSPPWPGPDLETPATKVWSDFSPVRVRERAEAIFSAALQCYDYFTNTLLAPLASRMRIAATLPAMAQGTVSFLDRPAYEGAPCLRWHLEPLAADAGPPRAEFALEEGEVEPSLADLHADLTGARPDAARWIIAVRFNGVLDIFGKLSAAQQMYSWLWDDLAAIGWVEGLKSPRWPDIPPRLV